MPYQQILKKICLIGYFCMQNSIYAMKTVENPTIFMKNAKNKKNKLIEK